VGLNVSRIQEETFLSNDPTPIIYPEKVNYSAYPPIKAGTDDKGNPIIQQNPELGKAVEETKRVAKQTGHWITEEFKKHDFDSKLAQMVILTAKHGVSYIQVWPDAVEEAIRTQVYDAFDIFLIGSYTSIYDCPFLIKAYPQIIARIKANEMFDKEQLEKINPDNKHAGDEIKEAYMNARHGRLLSSDHTATNKSPSTRTWAASPFSLNVVFHRVIIGHAAQVARPKLTQGKLA